MSIMDDNKFTFTEGDVNLPRYICIHGHFYQPPRENPWLETVELQESAAPWHDWNARISAECYSRNAASRILNEQGYICRIRNNYSRMSFNIGPTLLTWLEENDPLCYSAILEADKSGQKRFSGHGPAMAQVYNHIIMPLASRRDKETQVKWGIADFQKRFGRMPEGMWLAECAVDTETLEVLAENGITFTVLSPYQAKEVRVIGWGGWQDVTGGRVDSRCSYVCKLPSGRSINLFFYDGVLSQKIAFAGLLDDGGNFAKELMTANPAHGRPVLCNVATDGESYGHHHKHGDMALAYCIECLEHASGAQLTVYGEYLEFYPPESEVKIIENSAWSCAHGVERWCDDCSCGDGTPGYHHKWRKPLRNAMNYLRDKLAEIYEGNNLLTDSWEARNKYINVILDRSDENVDAFLKENTAYSLTPDERMRALMYLEMQRNALLMFTSCGWFFDEISRIEPVQIMRYAARAIELARMVFGVDLEPAYLRLLAEAPSNVPELQDGAKIYELRAKQGRVDRKQMAAYYGITTLLKDFKPEFSEGCWDMKGNVLKLEMGEGKSFSAGKVHVNSNITEVAGDYLFAVKHDGGTMILCGICDAQDTNALVVTPKPTTITNITVSGCDTTAQAFVAGRRTVDDLQILLNIIDHCENITEVLYSATVTTAECEVYVDRTYILKDECGNVSNPYVEHWTIKNDFAPVINGELTTIAPVPVQNCQFQVPAYNVLLNAFNEAYEVNFECAGNHVDHVEFYLDAAHTTLAPMHLIFEESDTAYVYAIATD